VSNYLSGNYPLNNTLAYYGYGGMFEELGHQKAYADTIQELNPYSAYVLPMDRLFNSSISSFCQGIAELQPTPDFVLVSNSMLGIGLFANASANSILRIPLSFNNTCNYT